VNRIFDSMCFKIQVRGYAGMGARSASRDLRGFVLLLLLLSPISWISCSSGGGGGSPSVPANPSKVLSWDAPTQFADGGALNPATDLLSYEIYINETGNFLLTDTPTKSVDTIGRVVTTYDLGQIVPRLETGTTYFLVMRTVEKNGGRSGFSDPPVRFTY